MIDRGNGTPVILIPGLQGRLEWMAPTIESLARSHRVLSFSLGETNGAGENHQRAGAQKAAGDGDHRPSAASIFFTCAMKRRGS